MLPYDFLLRHIILSEKFRVGRFQSSITFQISFHHNDVCSQNTSTCLLWVFSPAFRHPERACSLISTMELILNCRVHIHVCFCYTWPLVALLKYWGRGYEKWYNKSLLHPQTSSVKFSVPLGYEAKQISSDHSCCVSPLPLQTLHCRWLFLMWDSNRVSVPGKSSGCLSRHIFSTILLDPEIIEVGSFT